MIKSFEDFLITEEYSRIAKVSLKDIANDFETGLPEDIAKSILKYLEDEVRDAIKNESLDDTELAKVMVWIGRNFRYNCMEVADTVIEAMTDLIGDWEKDYPETYITLISAFPIEGVLDEFEDYFDDLVNKTTKRAERFFPWNVENGKIKVMTENDI